jgi:hypothetical protein
VVWRVRARRTVYANRGGGAEDDNDNDSPGRTEQRAQAWALRARGLTLAQTGMFITGEKRRAL